MEKVLTHKNRCTKASTLTAKHRKLLALQN